ncbi:MAG: hypothetical protein HXY43_09985 [Fischerella sp.]|nr:hypothetical protein [Fischerella sp.]NWF59604.1 hypothetical protein [Fischerella sp.]
MSRLVVEVGLTQKLHLGEPEALILVTKLNLVTRVACLGTVATPVKV